MKAISTTDCDRSKPTGESITYLCNMITNNVRLTHEITSRIAMAKTLFNKKKTLFNSKLYVNLRKKLLKCFI
jgi:hypothetical protein